MCDGRFVTSKGIEAVLEVSAVRPMLRLEVVGSGPLGPLTVIEVMACGVPLSHRHGVVDHEALVRTHAAHWMAHWVNGQVIDLWEEPLGLSQPVLWHALFGSDFRDPDARFAQAVTTRRRYIEYYFTLNLPKADRWPLPIVRRYRTAKRTMTEERDGARLTNAQVRDEAVTLTSTGYETVAAAISCTGHLLLHHASLQHNVAFYVRDHLADAGAVTDEGRASVPTRALDQSMRLYPPTGRFIRRAATPAVVS